MAERDRLNAYVEPDTTKIIEFVKKKHQEEFGVKLTIGQCVDIMARAWQLENKIKIK